MSKKVSFNKHETTIILLMKNHFSKDYDCEIYDTKLEKQPALDIFSGMDTLIFYFEKYFMVDFKHFNIPSINSIMMDIAIKIDSKAPLKVIKGIQDIQYRKGLYSSRDLSASESIFHETLHIIRGCQMLEFESNEPIYDLDESGMMDKDLVRECKKRLDKIEIISEMEMVCLDGDTSRRLI